MIINSNKGVKINLPTVDTSVDTTKNFQLTQTVNKTGASAVDYYAMQIDFNLLADDVSDPFDLMCAGIHAVTTYGSESIKAKGTCHTSTFNQRILGSDNANNEICNIMGWSRNVNQTCSQWFTDFNMHGPNVKPGLLSGINMFMNNHYNGSPSRNTSNAIGIYTAQGEGGGADPSQDTETTYPIDLGLIISGYSGPIGGPNTNGFNIGLQIGGGGGSWLGRNTVSKIGTGMKILDCVDNCIDASSQGSLTGHILKLPSNGSIGRSSKGKLSWDSNDVLNISSSVKIGTTTTQKVGFYGKTPVTQRKGISNVDSSTVDSTYDIEESKVIASLRTKLNAVIQVLEDLGITGIA
jgi:hypothetical protein